MNILKLLVILITVLISCKAPTDSKENANSLFDLNVELAKRHSDVMTYYPEPQIDSILGMMLKNDTIATAFGKSQDNTPYLLLARTTPGDAEIHEQVDDVAIIRSGHGTLKTGHQVSGKIRTVDNEPWRNWFCETINEATERKLSPGDFIIIPAMTAHQYIPDQEDTLVYWTIKVNIQNPKTRFFRV
jgi:mannose-6-phosphate isomerase-like protein (cupin superfamily)